MPRKVLKLAFCILTIALSFNLLAFADPWSPEKECEVVTQSIPDVVCRPCPPDCVHITTRAGDKFCKKCNEFQCDLKDCQECSDQECVK